MEKKTKIHANILVWIAVALLLGGVAYRAAAGVAGYTIPWDALTSGSEQARSAHYSIQASIGQALADAGASSAYGVEAGFWSGVGDTAVLVVYLPLVLK